MKTLDKKKSIWSSISRYVFAIMFISSWAVLGFTLALSSVTVDVQGHIKYEYEGSPLIYTLDTNKMTASVSIDPEQIDYTGEIVIPASVEQDGSSYLVKAIDEEGFKDCEGLTGIEIPSSVRYIGANAFSNCSLLTSVEFALTGQWYAGQQSVASTELNKLTSSYVGRVWSYGAPDKSAFSWECDFSFDSQNATASARCYDDYYTGKEYIYNVAIPSKVGDYGDVYVVTSIQDRGFAYASNLQTVTIPTTVTTIGSNAFKDCSSLTSAVFETVSNWQVTKGDKQMAVFGDVLESSSTAASVLGLFSGADYGKWQKGDVDELYTYSYNSTKKTATITDTNILAIKELTIPRTTTHDSETYTVTALTSYLFEDHTELEKVTIPNNIIDIYMGTFYGCTYLSQAVFEDGDDWYGFEYGYSYWEMSFSNPTQSAEILVCRGDYSYYQSYSYSKTPPDGSYYSDLYFFVNSDGDASVMSAEGDYGSLTASGSIYIPEKITINGNVYTVTRVEAQASQGGPFAYTEITSISLPETITYISDRAFEECKFLTSISIPRSTSYIGVSAFQGCTRLSSVNFYGQNTTDMYLEYIEADTFKNCSSLTSINIPGDVMHIGNYAFAGSGLTSVGLPNDLQTIGEYAFANSNLTSVELPASLATIGKYAFSGCNSLSPTFGNTENWYAGTNSISRTNLSNASTAKTLLTSTYVAETWTRTVPSASQYTMFEFSLNSDGTLSVATKVDSNGNKLANDEVEIPARVTYNGTVRNVTRIADEGFKDCSAINYIYFPTTLRVIGENALNGCTALRSIYITDNVNSIASTALLNTPNISSVQVSEENGYYYSENNNSIYTRSTNVLIHGRATTVIKAGTTAIGPYAFSGCTGLSSITIPESVTSIGKYAFSGCTGLSSITIPAGVMDIGAYSFNGVYMTSATFNYVNDWFFSNGNYVNPDTLSVSASARELLYSLESVGITRTPAVSAFSNILTFEDFDGTNKTCAVKAYNSSISGGANIPTQVKTENGTIYTVTKISSEGFKNCSSITSVRFPRRLVSIEAKAFYNCTGIKSVTFPDTLETIKAEAFYNCGIEALYITKNITSFEADAFLQCPLKTLRVLAGNSTYSSYENGIYSTKATNLSSFSTGLRLVLGCKNTIIQEGTVAIGEDAFRDCSGLTSIVLPESLLQLDARAFQNSGLFEITIPFDCMVICENAFFNCANLDKVNLSVKPENWSVKLAENNYYNIPNNTTAKQLATLLKTTYAGYSWYRRLIIED